ncbi:hypothetical protein Saa2_09391 [Streptomyces acidiscabies]|nr:hypothetical protein Saa2_09391 [Streptomyces acidiscabies]
MQVVVERPRAQWPALRDAGQTEAADLLSGEVAAGRMNDVGECSNTPNGSAPTAAPSPNPTTGNPASITAVARGPAN